jgi:hypothetical protein
MTKALSQPNRSHKKKKTQTKHAAHCQATKQIQKQKTQTMKCVQMITAALAGTGADWDYWGSLSSMFKKNTKTTKIMFPSRQEEIAAILTAPPSIFVPGYTVLDSPAPLLFILHVVDDDDDVASFDLTTINSPLLDLLHSAFSFGESSLCRVVPSAGEFLEMKSQVQEGIAAQFKHWNAVKTVAAQSVRRWTMEFLKAHTSILPRYVWNLVTVSETIWQWRFVLQVLTLVVRLTAASTTPWMALVLVPKALLATLRALDVPQKLFCGRLPTVRRGLSAAQDDVRFLQGLSVLARDLERRSQRATSSVNSYHDGRGDPGSRELGDATIGGGTLVLGARSLPADGGLDWILCLVSSGMISFCVVYGCTSYIYFVCVSRLS